MIGPNLLRVVFCSLIILGLRGLVWVNPELDQV